MPTQRGSGPVRGHVCQGYRRRAEFTARARDFLAAGLAAGERVLYVAPGDEATLIAQLRETGRFDAGLRRGAVLVSSVDSTYTTGTVVDPAGQVRLYAAATEEALAAGFTGLRVAADATSLVRTPAQLDAFARYEHLVDRYMAAHPMSAMCGYDLTELGDDAVAQLACMHPVAHEGATPFHLHGHAGAGTVAALAGELDSAVRRLWPLALERADLRAAPGLIAIDAGDLGFMDHRSLFAVADYAERHAKTVVLRTRLTTPGRLLGLFDLTGVRVEGVS
ncbi:MEDS: MEthanogen/methylotroph, DcmR Sensory domain [Amycolatopsis pretoriensis]|uniref:MEDS: MEthanogen/methylotroph, DcmR Sensory domain n=1 Tax=Amycolatopsis pretoriensis TaxID=218821 RepID=A0A1H5Q243_9PSEU|nr:MEDS domain-containing protein [Amycolatopsis pretoriensis]SEF19999.1 MEDS: MEthanogen/methylotroph, DcmR Sensory domain [Amycolatopsis pretoriensis]